MAGDGAVVGASSTKDHYAFGESNAARRAFAGRTIDADLAFLVPFLKPGLSLVDCGCGGGGLAVQLSERLTPGEVVGFDQNGGAIEQAKQLAASVADARVRFFVASVYDAPLPQQHFDIALFCGVLGHIPDPELALRHAFNVLKPGGVIAVRELAKNGDWAGGLHWETVEAVNQMHADDIAVSGGDPFIGRRMKSLLVAFGFERVDALPSFSPALSSVQAIGALFSRRLQEPDFVERVVKRGRHSADRLREMAGEIARWMNDDSSIVGISECTALGWKPQ
jgi:SAM-dependent methyltransferase